MQTHYVWLATGSPSRNNSPDNIELWNNHGHGFEKPCQAQSAQAFSSEKEGIIKLCCTVSLLGVSPFTAPATSVVFSRLFSYLYFQNSASIVSLRWIEMNIEHWRPPESPPSFSAVWNKLSSEYVGIWPTFGMWTVQETQIETNKNGIILFLIFIGRI